MNFITNEVNTFEWWHSPLTPVFGRQRQVELWDFEASLVYTVSSRTVRTSEGDNRERKEEKKERNLKILLVKSV